jgi:hypothetical protein
VEVLSLMASGTSVIPYCTYAKTHTSKGKVKKMMMKYATKVTDGLNKLTKHLILNYTSSGFLKSSKTQKNI